jgi:hypothetical protein
MRRRAGVIGVSVLVVGGHLSGALAWATESSTAVAGIQVSTATLHPPGSVSATVSCPNKKKGDVLVTWTASSSAFTTGYTVTRSGGAAFTPVSLGAGATSYDDTTVVGATTYTYTVTATYLSWSAAGSAPAVTTAARC